MHVNFLLIFLSLLRLDSDVLSPAPCFLILNLLALQIHPLEISEKNAVTLISWAPALHSYRKKYKKI